MALGHGQLTLGSGVHRVGLGRDTQLEGLEGRWQDRCSEVSSCHPYPGILCHYKDPGELDMVRTMEEKETNCLYNRP